MGQPVFISDESFAYMATRENIARIIAYDHFARRPWTGACTKEARTAWLTDQYWPQFAHTAELIMRKYEI